MSVNISGLSKVICGIKENGYISYRYVFQTNYKTNGRNDFESC